MTRRGGPMTRIGISSFGLSVLCFVGVLATGARAAVPGTVCHKPDTVNVSQTMRVGRLDVAEHLAHDDSLGACPTWHSGPPAAVAKTGQTGGWGSPNSYPAIDCAG